MKFATLPELTRPEKALLTVLSAALEPINPSDMLSLVTELDIRDEQNKGFNSGKLQLLRDLLVKRGHLTEVSLNYARGYRIATPILADALLADAISKNNLTDYQRAVQLRLPWNGVWASSNTPYNTERCIRDMRLAIFQRDISAYNMANNRANQASGAAPMIAELHHRLFMKPDFQPEWLMTFPDDLQLSVLNSLVNITLNATNPTFELEQYIETKHIGSSTGRSLLASIKYYKGSIEAAQVLLANPQNSQDYSRMGAVALLGGQYEEARLAYEHSIKLWRKEIGKRKGFPDYLSFRFYPFALLQTRDINDFPKIVEYTKFIETVGGPRFPEVFNAAIIFLKNDKRSAESALRTLMTVTNNFDKLARTIVASWVNTDILVQKFVRAEFESYEKNGYLWHALEYARFLAIAGGPEGDYYQGKVNQLIQKTGIKPLCDLIPKTEDWERAIGILATLGLNITVDKEKKSEVGTARLAWLVDFEEETIQPVEQKLGKTGWSAGRNVALKRLKQEGLPCMSEQDKDIVNHALKVQRSTGGWNYYGTVEEYIFDRDELWKRLIGHPLLFLIKNEGVAVQLVRDEPQLIIQESGNNLVLQLNVPVHSPGFQLIKETNTRWKLLEIQQKHVQIANALGGEKLSVPKKGRESLSKAIGNISSLITVQSDLSEHTEHLPKVEADPRIHAVLVPLGEGFQLEFFVKPFTTAGPYLKPGKGAENIIADIDGTKTQSRRNLQAERELVMVIEEMCPTLLAFESKNYEWDLLDTELCLQVLLELDAPRSEEKLVIEWPKGERLRIAGSAGFGNLHMGVKRDHDWFGLSGEIRIDETTVLTMQQMMKLLGKAKGNFVEVSDGQYIALTEQFRQKLDDLRAIMDDKGRFHPLAAGLLEDFAENAAEFNVDKHWKENLRRLSEARAYQAELPKTFEADLRTYQMEGFRWLSQLAQWGVGACLADDMGLGKTVQTLAVLVDRAEMGPAMVIAPVSVCRNWMTEAARFAPTLNVMLLGVGDRKEMVDKLQPYDLLVVSYGLLQGEAEMLEQRHFATIVIDEAQAIKNRSTKRSKAAMALNADFKVITTGTPVENHLGELWNLFNFINPGLLGSIEQFNDRYATPIEKFKDDEKRRQLSRLIRPFVLRRRKNQVLSELPPKTEIVLSVEQSPEERAFYEALRREAVDKIENEGGRDTDKRFRILAELMRLRLACCHPKLVDKSTPLSSSKLELFSETVDELLEGNHKALVFSQFTMHLAIIREQLDKKKISYQYLDGSTPPNERQKRIEAFQRGEGDLFLISLKAGGTGLNLTAADYVLHLDPWWNPAVEDQASDRAHRIGQQRPVTVYRLVTAGTVEEKIVKLHEQKRDLADSLLAGTDSGGRMSAEDLLDLIRGN